PPRPQSPDTEVWSRILRVLDSSYELPCYGRAFGFNGAARVDLVDGSAPLAYASGADPSCVWTPLIELQVIRFTKSLGSCSDLMNLAVGFQPTVPKGKSFPSRQRRLKSEVESLKGDDSTGASATERQTASTAR